MKTNFLGIVSLYSLFYCLQKKMSLTGLLTLS